MSKFTKLYKLYWQIRYTRNKSTKRRYYRYVATEKKRLIESGVDSEELRLMCRALSGRLNDHAERRLESKLTQDPNSFCNCDDSNCQ